VRLLTFLYKLVPKIGPFKYFSYKPPSPEAEKLFLDSFRGSRERFRQALDALAAGHLQLANTNFDLGKPSVRGEYALADDTYAELVKKLAKHHYADASEALREDIRRFYGSTARPH
jgi:hypothetical protein